MVVLKFAFREDANVRQSPGLSFKRGEVALELVYTISFAYFVGHIDFLDRAYRVDCAKILTARVEFLVAIA